MRPARPLAWVLAAVLVAAGGCATEEKIVAVRGGLQNIPGAEGGLRVEGQPARAGETWETVLGAYAAPLPGEPIEGDLHRQRTARGEIVLVSRSPRQLILHLGETLRRNEVLLLYQQVLSDRLKQNYEARGKDPREAVAFLFRHRDDVLRLLASMPLGDRTPGVTMQPLGGNAFRLRTPGGAAVEMRFTELQVVIEDASFRLLLLK